MLNYEVVEILKDLSPSNSIVALDLETTGLDINKDRIIEIGATKLNLDTGEFESYSQLIDPITEISEFITDLTGIRPEDLKGKPIIDEITDDFQEFLKDKDGKQSLIIAHNTDFDIGFLKSAQINFSAPIFDTYDLAYVLLDKGDYNLENLVNILGVKPRNFHRAYEDASATFEIFIELIKLQMSLDQKLNISMSNINFESNELSMLAPQKIAKAILNQHKKLDSSHNLEQVVKDEYQDTITLENMEPVNNVAEFFSVDKGLGKIIRDYEKRDNQIDMAKVVEKNISLNKITLIEASPGTGKTLAYLMPSVLWILQEMKRSNPIKVVISTNSIALQEQILRKEWEVIMRYLEATGQKDGIKLSVLKGRNNYACDKLIESYVPTTRREARVICKVAKWANYTSTGDVSEIDLKNDLFIFKNISSLNESCIKSCIECFVNKARKNAEDANIVLINHSLAFATSQTERNLLEDIDFLIIDEAHEIQNVATITFSKSVHYESLSNQSLNILRNLTKSAIFLKENNDLIIKLEKARDEFVENLKFCKIFLSNFKFNGSNFRNTKINLTDGTLNEMEGYRKFIETSEAFKEELFNFISFIDEIKKDHKKEIKNSLFAWINQANQLANQINDFLDVVFNENNNIVSWVQSYGLDDIEFCSAPISVRNEISESIFKGQNNILLTGATLTSFGSPEEFCREIGLDFIDEYSLIDSEFDYERNVLFCVPTDISDPNSDNYAETLAASIYELTKSIDEKALILFTSYTMLNKVRNRLKNKLKNIGKKLISQGVDGNANRVLKKFEDKNSILLGTGPLWQGIDFNDNIDIKILIITRLPFGVPSDPLFAARSSQHSNAFFDYALPHGIRRFKQGVGRLIRSKDDFGAIICTDNRIISKNYGEEFLNCLPGYTYKQSSSSDLTKYINDWLSNHA